MPALEQQTNFSGLAAQVAIARVARMLSEAGVEHPGRDARILTAAALSATSAGLLLDPGRTLDDEEGRALAGFARRRQAREPVSRILGRRDFYGRSFRISPSVLDPRPCSETLIDAALEVVRDTRWDGRRLRIFDVGTGSGALLLTLLSELPEAEGMGTDVCADALAVARENARMLGLSGRARFAEMRSLAGFEQTFDLLISNPPYIPSRDIESLEPEVRFFDPRGALDGGVDGLEIYREIASDLPRVLHNGWALFEVGAGQAQDVAAILGAPGSRTWTDLGGHTRCVAVKTLSVDRS
jgi:release factor glutamine methyltransferase